jgi:hypothetical protein
LNILPGRDLSQIFDVCLFLPPAGGTQKKKKIHRLRSQLTPVKVETVESGKIFHSTLSLPPTTSIPSRRALKFHWTFSEGGNWKTFPLLLIFHIGNLEMSIGIPLQLRNQLLCRLDQGDDVL